jgi:ACR3 family arsenite transporter
VRPGPFLHAFVWLIALPLALAGLVKLWASRTASGRRTADGLGYLPVPTTALVLFLVVAATVPLLGSAAGKAIAVGLAVGRAFGLGSEASRSVAFSSATRNSLVVLPLALAVPRAVPVLPAVIVTQTLMELVSQLIYIRLLPMFGRGREAGAASS